MRWVLLRFVGRIGISAALALTLAGRGMAQSTPPPGVTLPPNTPQRVDETIPPPPENVPIPVVPPQPLPEPGLAIPTQPQPGVVEPPTEMRFQIERIEVLGNTVLQDEIAALIQPFENSERTFEELIALRAAITQLYISNGYITSGAFLPNNQNLTDGVVQIQVVEGELEQINIEGLRRLRESYVRSRVARATDPPLNEQRLLQSLQLLQLDPLLQQVNAELTAGSAPGRNVLNLQLRETSPFSAGINTANNQSPSVGSSQFSIFAGYNNLLGLGDRLYGEYGFTEGLDSYEIGASVPFNPMDGTISVRFNRSESEIITEEFEELGIRSESETWGFAVRQPIVRTPNTEFALGLGLDLRESQTFILDDIPFSFSEGPVDGEARVTVLRLSQDWLDRDARRVLAARSQFSIGLDAFNATVNDSPVDGEFIAWLGQFQWVQQLTPRILMVSRLNAQLSPDPLLSLEEFSLGGADTIRGYRQNQLVADNGVSASLEFRIPITENPSTLQLTPFAEAGVGWNNRGADPDPGAIASIGMGLRWQVIPDLNVRVDYGLPLVEVDDADDSFFGDRFHFSVQFQPF